MRQIRQQQQQKNLKMSLFPPQYAIKHTTSFEIKLF